MSDAPQLAAIFLANAPAAVIEHMHDGAEILEQRLQEIVADAQEAWPEVKLPPGEFIRHLAHHTTPEIVPQFFPQAIARDLYLACACALGLPAALRAVEQRYLVPLAGFLAHTAGEPAVVEEAMQVLRDKLFVSPDGTPPKIADYAGRATLPGWLRTVGVRTVRSIHRHEHGAAQRDADEAAMRALSLGQDPELDFIKGRYRVEFREAFQQALAALTQEQRQVVRLHYLDGLNIDKIGALLHVHRATVARWRTDAREAILREMRRSLRERLSLSPGEFDSLAGLVQSQLDVSITRLLKTQEDGSP